MRIESWKKAIAEGKTDGEWKRLYRQGEIDMQRSRYLSALDSFSAHFSMDGDVILVSVPGRVELSGNHTDHNGGKVLCASVDADLLCVVSPRSDRVVNIESEGMGRISVNLDDGLMPCKEEYFSSTALVRGVARGMLDRGYHIGGFDAYLTSCVAKGSGISSSAAFEVLVGKVFSALYEKNAVSPVTLAQIAKFSENEFFGKPCGLMDQMACAVGGVISIDFADGENPKITRIDTAWDDFSVCITNVGESHADLNEEYAGIPAEMKQVAAFFGKDLLCRIEKKDVVEKIPQLRAAVGDRAVLRAMHFFDENDRVEKQVRLLQNGDWDGFLSLLCQSGRSSFCYLQNVYSNQNPSGQGMSLALALSEQCLSDKRAGYRVHGGGFAGTVLAVVSSEHTDLLCGAMDAVFGENACRVMKIRPIGALSMEEI